MVSLEPLASSSRLERRNSARVVGEPVGASTVAEVLAGLVAGTDVDTYLVWTDARGVVGMRTVETITEVAGGRSWHRY